MLEKLKKITSERKLLKMEQESSYLKIIAANLEAFRDLKAVHSSDVKETFAEVRSTFLPRLKQKYLQNDSTEMHYEMFDPSYLNAVDRAVSGIQSYHIPPNDVFFKLDTVDFGRVAKEKVDTDLEASLAKRQEEIHKVLQFPENYLAETAIQRDKFLFGFCGKVVEYDDTIVARIAHHPPESVLIGSSNGKFMDIYGICEDLTWQQIAKRYPEPLDMSAIVGRSLKFGESETETIYRMNIPKDVLLNHLKACMYNDYDKNLESFIKNKLAGKKNENWVDIHFTEETILSIGVQDHRNIMVPTFSPGADQTDLSKGVGERAIPLVVMLSELEIILLTGADRTYAPAWFVHSELQGHSLRLGRNEITFGDTENMVQPLGLNADIRGMVELKEYKTRVLDRLLFLDVFELIHKNRMPTSEIEMRRSDDFRKLGLFLASDETTNLNPTVLLINKMIHERTKEKTALADKILKAVYSSPVAFSHRNTEVEKAAQLFQVIAEGKKLDLEDSPINDYFDFGAYLSALVSHMGVHNLIRSKEDMRERGKKRSERVRIADLTQQTEALHRSNALGDQSQQRQTQAGGGPQRTPQTGQRVPETPDANRGREGSY